ncbi:LysR family transcriptional regulator [Corynebacterium hylobatis]|uniref:LysR family transcriptional regulator n=1 Tax=Corynebacterium hylobatis TaxID=1859290 RepID=A0A430HXB3_9CORY|nr:LysR family transcriptional regulator [Corynebacterium hylobatis]RSZ62850.1 LysR family transcriptional regulator [Corynebacterium hylobatis]
MDSRQLQHFRAIVEHGSFTAAAEALLMAQPSLSTAVKNLEKELGAQLLIRTRSGVVLTESGQEVYRLAVQVLDQMEYAAARVRGFSAGDVGRVVMNVAPTFNWEFLPQLVRQLKAESPGVDFILEDPDPATTLTHIREGQADIGILPTDGVEALRAINPDLSFEVVSRVDLMLALPLDETRPGDEGEIQFAEVAHLDWFIPRIRQGIPGLPEMLEAHWRHHPETRPKRIHHVATIQTALPLVAGGAGVTLAPRSLGNLTHGMLSYRGIKDEFPPLTLVAVWHPGRYQTPVVTRVLKKILTTTTPTAQPPE